MREEWKIIQDYENYSISNLGNVRNNKTGKILKHQKSERGGWYPFINLCKNGKRVNRNIHKIVANTFLGETPCGHVVHHKDNNRNNPKLNNLEFKTYSENSKLRI